MLEARVVTDLLDVSLSVGEEAVLIAGPNGAGKSSLLKALLGIVRLREGRILLDGRDITALPPEQRKLGYVPQDYALFPHLDVEGNVAFGSHSAPRTRELLDQLQLAPLAQRSIATLSGGERQRVALARALAPQPKALLLDEPFAALDAQARRQLRASLSRWLSELKLPALVVSHDPADAPLGQRIVVLERGRVVQEGSLAELRAKPATAFVEELGR